MNTPGTNGWGEWANYVLKELERQEEEDKSIKLCMTELKIKVAELNIKSGLWSAIGAAIPVLMLILIQVFMN
jgi:hypothetical protein